MTHLYKINLLRMKKVKRESYHMRPMRLIYLHLDIMFTMDSNFTLNIQVTSPSLIYCTEMLTSKTIAMKILRNTTTLDKKRDISTNTFLTHNSKDTPRYLIQIMTIMLCFTNASRLLNILKRILDKGFQIMKHGRILNHQV